MPPSHPPTPLHALFLTPFNTLPSHLPRYNPSNNDVSGGPAPLSSAEEVAESVLKLSKLQSE